jgi:hypothetical protein
MTDPAPAPNAPAAAPGGDYNLIPCTSKPLLQSAPPQPASVRLAS